MPIFIDFAPIIKKKQGYGKFTLPPPPPANAHKIPPPGIGLNV